MKQRRNGHHAIRLASGTVLEVEGTSDYAPQLPVMPKTAENFDPASATWLWTGSSTISSSGPLSLLSSGKVLMISGSQAELYDPETGAWSPTGSSGKSSGTVTQLRNGQVLIGGGSATGVGALASAEVYDPSTGTWSAAGSVTRKRQGHGATLMLDGRVLVSGGRDRTEALTSTEFYDPDSGTWSSGPPLLTARWNHSSSLLPSGAVLVMGGNSGPPTTSLRSVELHS